MKRIKTENEWQAIIAEQKKSGKTVAEYCLKQGIHPNVFYTKRKKYERAGFVKLPVIAVQCDCIRIKIRDITIEAVSGFNQQELVRVIAAIREVVNA